MSRAFLTEELTKAKAGKSLSDSLRAIRAAFRQFVNAAGPNARNFRGHSGWRGTDPYSTALENLRALVGLHLAVIAGEYDIEIEPDPW